MRLHASTGLARACLLVSLAVPAAAQLADDIDVEHRDGQTFVTWSEVPESGLRYRVYRATRQIRDEDDLDDATLLGEVDDRSSWNAERSRVERATRNWVIETGSAALADDVGLFVHTVTEREIDAYYAVTLVRAGRETRSIDRRDNATERGLRERSAPPQAVLQVVQAGREVFGHWVGNRDTPFQPALALNPSTAFAFAVESGSAPGARGLMLRLHPAGGSYAQGWPARTLVPADVDVLALSDLHAAPGYSFWFGAHERYPAAPFADTRVWPYTQARILWTLDWLLARRGAALDRERVSIGGSSLGAIGGMYLLEEEPERFSAALLRSGNYDLRAGDLQSTSEFEQLWGPLALDLRLRGSGLGLLTRTTARAMAQLDPGEDWPVIRTLDGRNDLRVGWRSALDLHAGLAETWRPAVMYFDERTHSGRGTWTALERKLVQRTCQVRRDRPSLRFSACTLDDDPGDGTRGDGSASGTLNGRVEYDALTAAATPDSVRFDVFLRGQKAPDDAQTSLGYVGLTPRRTGPFAPAPGELVHFTLREGTALVAEHWLTADAHGLVHTPLVPLTLARREARFTRGSVPLMEGTPGLALGGTPLPGEELSVLLHGRPGGAWRLFALPGDAIGPRLGGALALEHGELDQHGRSSLALAMTSELPPGTWIWARARIDDAWTEWHATAVQSILPAPAPAPERR